MRCKFLLTMTNSRSEMIKISKINTIRDLFQNSVSLTAVDTNSKQASSATTQIHSPQLPLVTARLLHHAQQIYKLVRLF